MTKASDDLTKLLEERHLTISCIESATCGLIAKLLTDRSGSSAWFWGGAATYANEAKTRIAGVDSKLLEDPKLGPISAECAMHMADGMRRLSGTDIAISVTGIAGPTGEEEGKPVGTVYYGISSKFGPTEATRMNFEASSRDEYRQKFASFALKLVRQYILNASIN